MYCTNISRQLRMKGLPPFLPSFPWKSEQSNLCVMDIDKKDTNLLETLFYHSGPQYHFLWVICLKGWQRYFVSFRFVRTSSFWLQSEATLKTTSKKKLNEKKCFWEVRRLNSRLRDCENKFIRIKGEIPDLIWNIIQQNWIKSEFWKDHILQEK
jgi:hypothetical protein